MRPVTLPYGTTHLQVTLPDSYQVDELLPQTLPVPADIDRAIREALMKPLGNRTLSQFRSSATVGIAINDKTRPIPKPNPIRHLLAHLNASGFAKEQITLFIGSGTHAPMTTDELTRILDEDLIQQYPVIVHDCDQSPMADLGKTTSDTPVQINQAFYDCDLKISVGNIEPHHFMGFSGGVKTAAIGLASRETINSNHAMLTRENTRSGVYHINPMRQDVEEIGRKAKVHFSLGTVLNEEKQIMQVFFGDPRTVMQAGIPGVREAFGVTLAQPYDLVIASPGGAPKDINLYQAQKGLTHAANIAKDGGWVILLAACPEGSGSAAYEEYISRTASHQAVIQQFQAGYFEVGPHKAYQIAKAASRVNIILVSDIPPKTVKPWKLTPSQPDKLNALLEWLSGHLPAQSRVAILPAATRTMAEVKHAAK